MVDLAAFLGSLIWSDWGGHPEEASQARDLGAVIANGLQAAGYRVVKQEQVGWIGPYGIVPGGMDIEAPEEARARRGWKPVWMDLP